MGRNMPTGNPIAKEQSALVRLLDEIVHCPVVDACHRGEPSPCSQVVATQDDADVPFQVPEPWSGHLETAPILFLSSNPSIDDLGQEEYPAHDWAPDKTRAFFNCRFGGSGGFNQIQDGSHMALKSRERGKSVSFWSSVKKHARDILGYEAVPGVDYALSEVVHCKSRKEA
jgi:hypothetical protein